MKIFLFISLLPSGQHIKKNGCSVCAKVPAGLPVQPVTRTVVIMRAFTNMYLHRKWLIQQTLASKSLFFLPVSGSHQTIWRNAARDGEIHFQAQSSQSISPFFPLLIVLQIRTQTNTWLPCSKLDIKNSTWLWQHWLSFDRFIERRGL